MATFLRAHAAPHAVNDVVVDRVLPALVGNGTPIAHEAGPLVHTAGRLPVGREPQILVHVGAKSAGQPVVHATASRSRWASNGGTALPIWRNCAVRVPVKVKSGGND